MSTCILTFIAAGIPMLAADSTGSFIILEALAVGFCIVTLVVNFGGQINPAVSIGLMFSQDLGISQGICNIAAQFFGGIVGALLLIMIIPSERDRTIVGTNSIQDGFDNEHGLAGEVLMTFILQYTVYRAAVDPKANKTNAPTAIGFAVALGHMFLVPITGCSINPARAFGPALVAFEIRDASHSETFEYLWIFTVGPIIGAVLAALFEMGQRFFQHQHHHHHHHHGHHHHHHHHGHEHHDKHGHHDKRHPDHHIELAHH